MQISIIMPVYNRSQIVTQTLDSITSQTFKNFELIVVDNNSSDHTLDVIKGYLEQNKRQDIRIKILSETIPGAAAARNKGLSEVSNEWILFFDSDDLMEPNLLAAYADAVSKAPQKPDMVFAPTDSINLDGSRKPAKRPSTDPLADHILHAAFYTIAYIVRKDIICEVGGWDPHLMGWNDWELGVRLLTKPRVIQSIKSTPLAHHVCQEESITGTGYSQKWAVWEKSIDKVESVLKTSSLQNKAFYLWLVAYRRLVLAGLCTKEKSPQGKILYRKAMHTIKSDVWLRPLFSLLYRYISWGGVGGSHIARTWIAFFTK